MRYSGPISLQYIICNIGQFEITSLKDYGAERRIGPRFQ